MFSSFGACVHYKRYIFMFSPFGAVFVTKGISLCFLLSVHVFVTKGISFCFLLSVRPFVTKVCMHNSSYISNGYFSKLYILAYKHRGGGGMYDI